VTATADEAQEDLDFCPGAAGLRPVKRTVNFDNHHVFHVYYGDAMSPSRSRPGRSSAACAKTRCSRAFT
jgi:catechol 2,3-dioxygenase-like lactoylglutathione lyase family enzyme